MPQPIILTGRFRSGSTLLWNLLRQLDGVVAYYEPLHPKLLHYLRHPPSPQPRHFHVASYFDEYPPIAELRRLWSPELGVTRLLLEEQDRHAALEAYLRHLVAQAGEGSVAVLKLNRVDFRLPWLRERFPEARIVHIHRSCRRVWSSLLVAAGSPDTRDLDADPFHLTTWSRDLWQSFPFLFGDDIEDLYQRHYYLWKLSRLAGDRIADLSFSYEGLLRSPRAGVERLLDATGLRSAGAVDAALRVVATPEPEPAPGVDETALERLESACEARLDALGMNAGFGARPLREIVDASREYRELVADPGPMRAALRSAQLAVVAGEVLADEKELVIHDLAGSAAERARVDAERERVDAERERVDAERARIDAERVRGDQERLATIAWLRGEVEATRREGARLLDRAAEAEAAAEARLRVIEEQQRALDAFRRRNLRERIRRFTAPRLGILHQHPPRPLVVPARYRRGSAPSPCPTLSVVTPSLNQGGFIGRTIESVLAQEYPRLEYLVQDGGSTDETASVLESYGDRLRHRSGPDGGQADALNRGFADASGELMAYLNADDCLLPGALRYVGNYFARHADVDVVYGHRVIVDEHDQEIGRWVLPAHDGAVLTLADYVPQETLFWRRRIWDRVGGGIDDSFHFAMDWDLLLRFQEAGARFVRLPRFLGVFRVHPHQKTSAEMESRGLAEMDRLRKRCHGRSLTQAEIHRRIRPYLVRHLVLQKLYRAGLLRY